MNELFQEIEEDIRREKLDRLWQSFGKIMVWVSIAVVLATVVVVAVQNRREAQAMGQTAQFLKGLDRLNQQDYKEAVTVFSQLSADDTSSYYGVAMLRKAQAQNASGDKDGALRTYQALAAHGGAFGELAEMQGDSDKMTAPDKRSPFYYLLSEGEGWRLLKNGKRSEALARFSALRDDADAPFSLRQRMQAVVGTMNDKLIKKDK